jgi:hypothetical protein
MSKIFEKRAKHIIKFGHYFVNAKYTLCTKTKIQGLNLYLLHTRHTIKTMKMSRSNKTILLPLKDLSVRIINISTMRQTSIAWLLLVLLLLRSVCKKIENPFAHYYFSLLLIKGLILEIMHTQEVKRNVFRRIWSGESPYGKQLVILSR